MKKYLKIGFGFTFAAVMVYLVFRKTDWGAVWQAIQGVSVGWFLLAQVPMWLVCITRVQRWSYIVRASKPVRFWPMFSATQIGFLANFTLPARIGELVRGLILKRHTGIPFVKTMAMVALDRVTDFIGLLVIMAVAILSFPLENDLLLPAGVLTENPVTIAASKIQAAETISVVVLFGLILMLVLIYLRAAWVIRLNNFVVGSVSKRISERLNQAVEHFADGLHIFRSPKEMLKATGFTLITWGSYVLAAVLMFKAFQISTPWYTVFVMQTFLAIMISIPGAPGAVGQFHLPIVITLVTLSDTVTTDQAKAVAIMLHLTSLIPVYALGLYCLSKEHVGLRSLRQESEHAKQEVEQLS